MGRRFGFRSAAAALFVLSMVGHAERASANDPLAAQALYDDGKRLMNDRRFAEACTKFAESQKLDPGVGTHYALADCYEAAGRLATAWVTFLDVLQESNAQGRADRSAVAKKRADALQPRVARVSISVADAARVPGLVVTRDGEELGAGQWGTAVPVDPGRHAIVAKAPGKREWTSSVDVAVEGKTFTVEVPKLEDTGVSAIPSGTVTAPTASATIQQPLPPPPEKPQSSGGLGTQKILAIAVAGVGLVGIGVGSYFGLQSMSNHNDSASHCVGNACDPTGLQLVNDGKSAGNLSTIFFAVGAAGIAGGVVLWITAPKSTASTRGVGIAPLVGRGTGGLTLQGAW